MIDLNNPPEFFSLNPKQYQWLLNTVRELIKEKELVNNTPAYTALKKSWKLHQKRYPNSSERFKAGIRKAYQRGLAWTLEPDEYESLILEPCSVCNGDVGKGIGLDRIDNKQGYNLNNVRPCCGPCNIARGSKPILY